MMHSLTICQNHKKDLHSFELSSSVDLVEFGLSPLFATHLHLVDRVEGSGLCGVPVQHSDLISRGKWKAWNVGGHFEGYLEMPVAARNRPQKAAQGFVAAWEIATGESHPLLQL